MANPLIAFALVADEYERSGDPIKGLGPLFRPVFQLQNESFNAKKFAEDFTAQYGLVMTEFIANALSERFVEMGLLRRGDGPMRQLVPVKELTQEAFLFDESSILATIEVFAAWAGQEVARLGRNVSREALEDALLTRLARPEFSSVFLEGPQKRDGARIKRLLGRAAVVPDIDSEPLFDFLVARFVLTSKESAPEVFDELASISFGALIAEAVAGLATPGIKDMPDPALRVVIDGPLILDMLGMNDEEHQKYAEGLFDLMTNAKLRLATFDHVVDEVRESIRAVLKAYASGSEYGPLGARMRSTRGLSVQAASVADTIEERILDLGIDVLRTEIYERADFKKYFTDEAFDRMRNAIGEVHLQVERRLRDTKSVAGVIRLKRDIRKPASVFQAGTIFVTRNSALYKRVNRVLSIGVSEPDPRFSVITDSQLAGVLWFSLGSAKGYSALSKRRLIANCASAIVPQREVLQRVADLLEDLNPELKAEFTTLMRDKRASMCPMRMTGGLVSQIDQEASFRVLEAMRYAIAEPFLEVAVRNEEKSSEVSREIQAELGTSRQAVSELQEEIQAQDETYQQQLLQLSLDIQGERASRRRARAELKDVRRARSNELELSLNAQRAAEARVLLRCRVVWTAATVIALAVTVFANDNLHVGFAILAFLLLVSVQFAPAVSRLFERLAAAALRPRQREVDFLRQQIFDLDGILAALPDGE